MSVFLKPDRRLTLAALGVVYGDIGTSPLYTLKAAFHNGFLSPNPTHIFGMISLIFWALVLVVISKYLTLVLRVSDKGEGGILTLTAMARRCAPKSLKTSVMMAGLIGACFFYGEVIITPAMSVLSSVEGLEILTPHLRDYIVPLAIVILMGLFAVQHLGSERIGRYFGGVMLIWFVSIGVAGVVSIVHYPPILSAMNPYYAVIFIRQNPVVGFFTLSIVVLAITGVEALYADMGHFGVTPIRRAWFGCVFPALLLNYLGQGALLIQSPETARNPFFQLFPIWALLPMIILATLATVIASQAVISGVFSLTKQAIQSGYLPRMRITYTADTQGQIFMPFVNALLFVLVILVVLGFGSSSRLAAAYGLSVTGTMTITGCLVSLIACRQWLWPMYRVIVLLSVMLCIDLAFLASSLVKVAYGGWLPLFIGLLTFILITTWRRGQEVLSWRMQSESLPLAEFIDNQTFSIVRAAGTAIFMSKNSEVVPKALLHNMKHNKVLHERVIIMTIVYHDRPYHEEASRVQIHHLDHAFYQVVVHYGYKETPNLYPVLRYCHEHEVACPVMETSFFFSHAKLVIGTQTDMSRWRKVLFLYLQRNAVRSTDFFRIPANRIVELGVQIQL